jgi:hypothetical protein
MVDLARRFGLDRILELKYGCGGLVAISLVDAQK